MTELSFFRKTFSRERTFQWFSLVVLGFILTQDKLGGVSPLVRALGLNSTAYSSILNFFSNAQTFLPQLETSIYNWMMLRFESSLVKIDGRKIFIIDGKKFLKKEKTCQEINGNIKTQVVIQNHHFSQVNFLR
jgi:hypothetical protein